jgi:hypothetical protein
LFFKAAVPVLGENPRFKEFIISVRNLQNISMAIFLSAEKSFAADVLTWNKSKKILGFFIRLDRLILNYSSWEHFSNALQAT